MSMGRAFGANRAALRHALCSRQLALAVTPDVHRYRRHGDVRARRHVGGTAGRRGRCSTIRTSHLASRARGGCRPIRCTEPCACAMAMRREGGSMHLRRACAQVGVLTCALVACRDAATPTSPSPPAASTAVPTGHTGPVGIAFLDASPPLARRSPVAERPRADAGTACPCGSRCVRRRRVPCWAYASSCTPPIRSPA